MAMDDANFVWAHWGTQEQQLKNHKKPKSQKTAKIVGFWWFLPVFQPLLLRTSTYPNKFNIIRSHTLAQIPCKISAGSVHRVPSNLPRCQSTRAKNSENRWFLTDKPVEKNSGKKKFLQKNKSKTMLIQHVKGYPDLSMYSKNKGVLL